MRVVIDMQGSQSGSRFRGIGRYSLSFAQAIVRNRGEHEIFLTLSALLPESIESIRYAFADILPQENIRVWSGVEPVAEINEANHKNRLQSEILREAFICSLNPDLIHICSLFEGYGDDAVTSVGLFDKKTPVSVTLYDLIPLLNPKQYLDNDINYKKYYLNKVEHLKRCSVYLSISEFSKKEALDAKIITNSEKIFPVYGGISDFFRVQVISSHEKEMLNEKLNIKRPFVLFSGATDERKNIPRLLEAWSLLPQKVRNTYQIILAGGLPNEHLENFRQIAQNYGIQPYEICFTGYVPDDVFVKLYNMCTLYIFPSWHEGLGLPAMEAMACGAPVVGANTSSLPEVIGLDEALFDPFDVVAISHAIKKGILDKDYRQRLREHGLKQIKKFNWDKTARMTFNAWEKVLEYGLKDECLTKNQNNKRLLLELVNLDKKRLIELAGTIAKNQSMSLERQLFIDISCLYSELYSADEITRKLNLIKPIIGKHYNDYIPELVSLKEDKNYYYSRSATKLLNMELDDKADAPILWQRGDVFILLIADFPHLLNNINIYEELERNGVRVWIIRSNFFTHEYDSSINITDQHGIELFEFNELRTRLISSQMNDKKIYSAVKQKLLSQSDTSENITNKRPHYLNNELGFDYSVSGALRTILIEMPKSCNQLFVDISELVKKDAKTGIQRVVRNILQEWLNHPPKEYQVVPVYATEDDDYCYARRFTAEFLGHPDQSLIDEPIDYMIGDIFFILDLQPTVQISKRSYYEQLRQFGIRVYFLVYDLLCVRMPQYFGSGASESFSNWLDVVKENSGLICISKATADDFINWVNETTKHTVNTVNVAWSHIGAELIEIKEKHELSKEFCLIIESLRHVPSFLMVGTLEPRKGHMQVLDAFEKLWLDKIDVNLVIVGKQGWMMESFVERILVHPEIDRHLYWFGSINDEILDEIYDKSACLIAASYGEGFGLPLVESAYHNLPIICRDISVFREIAEDNAFYFRDDLKPETVSKAVINWLRLFKEDQHPKPNKIKWLTWSESALNMLDIIINKNWYASFKPDSTLLLDKVYNHKSALLNFENGWSHTEELHRWTDGYKSIMSFYFKDCEAKYRDILINCHTLGEQKIIVLLNGKKVYEQTSKAAGFEIILQNIQLKQFNLLTFELPNATHPSDDDKRILALAFKTLIICKSDPILINKNTLNDINRTSKVVQGHENIDYTEIFSNGFIKPFCNFLNLFFVSANTVHKFNSPALNWISGWSYPEENFRWSDGRESCIQFSFVAPDFNCHFSIRLSFHSAGRQEINILLNDTFLFDGTIDGYDKGLIFNDIKLYDLNFLTFKMPGAESKGNDPRALALAFHELAIYDNESCMQELFLLSGNDNVKNTLSIGIVIVTYSLVPENLLLSLKSRHKCSFYIFHHGSPVLNAPIISLFSNVNAEVHLYNQNRGLAKSWNEGIYQSKVFGNDITLVINDDVEFIESGFDMWIDFIANSIDHGLIYVTGQEPHDNGISVVRPQDFACFSIGNQAVDRVGAFDERFTPAYYEDFDYIVRARLAEIDIFIDERILCKHKRGTTRNNDPEISQNVTSYISINRKLMIKKWGGDSPESVEYIKPFNDPKGILFIPFSKGES